MDELDGHLSVEEKLNYLKNEFHIEDKETKRTVNGMCNLSIGFYNEDFNNGKAFGINKTIVDMIWNYAVKHNITIQKAMDELSVQEENRIEVWEIKLELCFK